MVWHLLATLVTGEAGNYIARLKRTTGFYAAFGIFLVAMLISLFGALFVFIASRYGSFATALGFAALFFILAVMAWIGVIVSRRPPKARAEDRLKRDIASIAGVAALTNASQLTRIVRRRKSLLLVPVAAVGGWAAWRAIASMFGDRD